MVADVLFNGLLQKQLADAIPEHTEDGFQRFTKDLGQEVSGVALSSDDGLPYFRYAIIASPISALSGMLKGFPVLY